VFYNTEVLQPKIKFTVSNTLEIDEGKPVSFDVLCEAGNFPIEDILFSSNIPIGGYKMVKHCDDNFSWIPPYDFVNENDKDKQKTVILSTHILPEVEATCDRILIINKGKIVADGTSDMLRKRARGEEMVRIQIKDSGNKDLVATALKGLDSVAVVDFVKESNDSFYVTSKENQNSRKDIFKLCVQKNWVLTEMTPIETKLEDIFRELTTN